MSSYFDATRVAELQDALGTDIEAILASMLASMTAGVERIEAAVAAGELEHAVEAVHRVRNDALMLSAGRLLAALTELEAAAREGDETRAEAGLEHVREVWPPTREGLAAAAGAA